MSQAEAIIARAPVISWDVNALVDTAAVVVSCTLVHICREMRHDNWERVFQQLETIKIQSLKEMLEIAWKSELEEKPFLGLQ